MATIIVLAIVAGILIACLVSICKRLGGKQSCCGTTREKTPKKKLKNVQGKIIINIEGMHCENCKRKVIQAINKLDGASAKVSLEKKQAVVSYEKEINEQILIEVIEAEGFIVNDIKWNE